MNPSLNTRRWLSDSGRPAHGWEALAKDLTHEVFFHADSMAYLKQFRQRAQYLRERDALTALRLRVPGVPSLLDSNDELGILITAACPGEPVTRAEQIEHAVWFAAGSWLAGLHRLPIEGPWLSPDKMPLAEAMQRRRSQLRQEMRQLPHSTAYTGFSDALNKWTWPTTSSIRVPCHRDFEPRNWLWSASDRTLWVVDFEHLRPDAPAVDMAKVLEVCGSNLSESWKQFRDGYTKFAGRWPADDEIDAAFVYHAARTWIWGERHDNLELTHRGLTMLAQLDV